jgi:hypothetical protein
MSQVTSFLHRIRDRIALGELPGKYADRLCIGPGTGNTCDGCGDAICTGSLEYRFAAPSADAGRALRFHNDCFQLWETETEQASAR